MDIGKMEIFVRGEIFMLKKKMGPVVLGIMSV